MKGSIFMNKNVTQLLKKKCRLNNFNSREGIRHLLGIPKEIDMDNLRDEILKCYQFFYLKKPKHKKEIKEERIARYLNPNIMSDIYKSIPVDYTTDDYRMLINIKKENAWLKKSLKKLNKILSSSLIERIKKDGRKIEIQYDVEYLHSSMKKRSYETNAKTHRGNNYVLAIDIQNFYPSIKEYKVYSFFNRELDLDTDIAKIYTILCTCPKEDPTINPNCDFGIGQGLSTSPILAYMVNYRMFDYIYLKALEYGIEMTVYVDDVVFSSDEPIPQKFIDSLFSIIKQNGMNIKRKKLHLYKKYSTKKITGVLITSTNRMRVTKSKHEELMYQYNYLEKHITSIKNINDYFNIYNLFLKFNGNAQFVNLVEGKILLKYKTFIEEYKKMFANGIKKIKKNEVYSKENLDSENYQIIIKKYEEIRKHIDNKKA